MEGDVLLASRYLLHVVDMHAEQHKHIAEGLAVAEPRRHVASEGAVGQTLPRELGEGG